MSSFATYNTDDPNVPAGTYPTLSANQDLIVGPVVTGIAAKIAGSCFSDTAGTLFIEQSFDGGSHFDVAQSIAVTGGTPVTINVDVIAPWMQVRFVNSNATNNHLRLFVRAFGNRASG